MRLYQTPPFWLVIGYLTGWVHFRPGLISGICYATAIFGMVIWITIDINPE